MAAGLFRGTYTCEQTFLIVTYRKASHKVKDENLISVTQMTIHNLKCLAATVQAQQSICYVILLLVMFIFTYTFYTYIFKYNIASFI